MALYVYNGNILIVGGGSASDGQSTHSDSPGPSGATTLSLNWTLPTTKADGKALGTISWVQILYATTEPTNGDPLTTQFPYWKWINSAATSGSVSSLASNGYWCAILAEDSSGNQSNPSPYFYKASV